ncbi:serine/threonine-protein kinase [Rhodopirellula sp. JC639]|uniref:serine/threonine-protein kinase n=1 Tax=Stieleria mannarensis TaxID=2755585 RepID=UPI00160393BE
MDDATLAHNAMHNEDQFDGPATESEMNRQGVSPSVGTEVRYFGEYELLDEIARGGMGVVFRARQTRLNRMVALKMILSGRLATEADVRRFQTEAEAAAQLDHPGIVPVFEVGQHDGHHFYSMALVEGESLAHRIAEGPLALSEAAELVKSVAIAVHHAHEKGVIHRDLKPANILIDRDGQARVTDFGLARQKATESSLTADGQVLGTPGYLSPEQATGSSAQVNEAADVYSLGAVLYAALTGRPPFQADTVVATLKQVAECDPVQPSSINADIDIDLQTIVQKCLEKRPEDRYASAAELAEELDRYLIGVPIHARPVGYSQRLWRWGRRRPLVLALVASVCVAILAIAGLIYQSSTGSVSDDELTPALAGQLVSEAASIRNDDWADIASGSTMPSASSFSNRSLSLILFSLFGKSLDQLGHSNAADDFHYAEPRPKPYQIAQAIWISKEKGYASFIQPEYITDCSVQQEGDTAHGTVSFSVHELYAGRLSYVARRIDGSWIVAELHISGLGVSLQRGGDGDWGPLSRSLDGETPEQQNEPRQVPVP